MSKALRGSVLAVALVAMSAIAAAQIPGRNVNMVSGTTWPDGDPFLQRQNEPTVAASTRNPLHLLAGANDYRTVDLPGLPDGDVTGDAWLGVFKSYDGGQRWKSTLVPGYPQDSSPIGLASPIHSYQAAADPVVRAGTNGLLYYGGLAFDRTANGRSAIFMARYIDNNNIESGEPIHYLDTKIIAGTSGAKFYDKPWIAVDVPRVPGLTCTIRTTDKDGLPVVQVIPAGPVYAAFSSITGEGAALRSEIYFTYSMTCGRTWAAPVRLSSQADQINQGATIAIDPATGAVYVAWRRFSVPGGPDADALMVVKSLDYGGRFTAPGYIRKLVRAKHADKKTLAELFGHRKPKGPWRVAELFEFDQPTSESALQFRTNAYPAMTFDGAGRLYVAWTERGFARLRPDPVDGDSRIVVATSIRGTIWSAPIVIDDAVYPGHQLMPSIGFAGGKLMLLYYDLREDVSQVFSGRIDDATARVSGKRHTMDIRTSMGTPGSRPVFLPSVKVSEYLTGNTAGATSGRRQLQFNPPNLPMFRKGTAPFNGDYIDLTPAPVFVPIGRGRWAYNTAGPALPVFHAVWTDNRDVRAPYQNRWDLFTPPVEPGTSIFDPTTLRFVETGGACVPTNSGSRNQNIYTARITGGLIAGSPGNAKPLSPTLQRGFVVYAQNTSNVTRSFRLTILNQPVGGRASFDQFPLPPYTPASAAPLLQLDVTTPPRSMAVRTVYVTSSDPRAQVTVSVTEIAAAGGADVVNGLQGSVILNPDIENPEIENPEIENPEIENPEIENAEVMNPEIENPEIENPEIENPEIENPEIENPEIENLTVANPDIENPEIENNPIANPDIENPEIENPEIENSALTDVSWTVTNLGNTTSAFNVNLFLAQYAPAGISVQLILRKVYKTPVTIDCTLKTATQNVLVASIRNPQFVTPTSSGLPDPNRPDAENATMWLAPGEKGKITLRIVDPDRSNNVLYNGKLIDPAFVPGTGTTPVVAPQGVDTISASLGETEPPAVTPDQSTIFFLQQPTTTPAGQTMAPVTVQVRDKSGAVAPGVSVTLALSVNPGGATLSGGGPVITDATGIATFSSIRVSAAGVGYRLQATTSLAGIAPVGSVLFDIVPFGVGAVTDPVGDALSGLADLQSATITVDTVAVNLSVRMAPGTFTPATSLAQFLLDTDENPATGHPGTDSSCITDASVIGSEFLVNVQGGGADVYEYAGECNTFNFVGSVAATPVADGYDVTVPLSMLGGDDGRMTFKTTTSEEVSPGGYTGVLDVMPDVGLSPGIVPAPFTIGFGGLAAQANDSPFTGYVESGFTVSPVSGSWLVRTAFGNPAPAIVFTRQAADPLLTAEASVTAGGAPFTFKSIDLYSSITTIPYTMTGYLNANVVFTASGTVPNTFGAFATVPNPSPSAIIDTLSISLTNPVACCANPMGFDNIVVRR